MNIQESNTLKTIYLVESGSYDDREIIGAYSRKSIAEEVIESLSKDDYRIIEITLEENPNLFYVFQQCKFQDKLSKIEKYTYTTKQFSYFIENNPCKFRIAWRKEYKSHPSETPREFGCFYAWGLTEEECEKNMIEGLKKCDEYES